MDHLKQHLWLQESRPDGLKIQSQRPVVVCMSSEMCDEEFGEVRK